MTFESDADQLVMVLVNEVFLASGALTRAGDGLTADLSLSASRWLVLGALQDGPVSIAAVGRRRGLRRQSARESIQRLERDGLISRSPDPDNPRSPLLSLTAAGENALRTIEPRRAAWAARLADATDPAQMRTTIEALQHLRRHLEHEEHHA